MTPVRIAYFRPALMMLVLLTLIAGVAYPLLTTVVSGALFRTQAMGSLVTDSGGKIIGSRLIGQNFTRPDYFRGRPSATADSPYNPLASGGSNLGPTNPALDRAVKDRVANLRNANPLSPATVPVDLVTASASGLDADISPEAAHWQAPGIAAARGLPLAQVTKLIDDNTSSPFIGFLGPEVVNVLALNHALDTLKAE